MPGQMEKPLPVYRQPGFLLLWDQGTPLLSGPAGFVHTGQLQAGDQTGPEKAEDQQRQVAGCGDHL